MGKSGKREFVQVLRLIRVFKIDNVAAAVRDVIARGAVGMSAQASGMLTYDQNAR